MLVALEERFMAARQRHAVHRLAGERKPQAEQEALDILPGQPDHDLAEVGFRLVARAVRLPHEHLGRAAASRPSHSALICGFRPAT